MVESSIRDAAGRAVKSVKRFFKFKRVRVTSQSGRGDDVFKAIIDDYATIK